MTRDKREKTGVKTKHSSAKSKSYNQRAKKKLSATLLCLLETEDELSNIRWEAVPLDIQKWLISTFAKDKGCKYKTEESTQFRTISRDVQPSVWKEKTFRVVSSPCGLAYPKEVIAVLKDVDQWSFDVFALSKASGRKSLKFMMCELFTKYNLLSQFKIPLTVLISFADALEVGYDKYKNSYHNSIHAADVTQTVHTFILHTGLMHWFTDLEILALIFSASIHDYEHTGTTNYFHIQTRSETAFLYNDKSVLENHHVSAVYKLMQDQGMNILTNLTEAQWRELRQLVIMMVLATDISRHFQHMSSMRQILHSLQHRERPDKPKVMCMILHTADLGHPSKPWELTYQWAEAIMEELYRQGDKETELGMPVSTFCDRKTISIAECQIVFIDLMVQPAFVLLLEVTEKIVAFLKNEAAKSRCFSSTKKSRQKSSEESKSQDKQLENSPTEESGTCTEKHTVITLNIPQLKANLLGEIENNRKKWEETTKKESPGKESNKPKDKVSKGKAEGGKTQKASKDKQSSADSKRQRVAEQSPTTCNRQLQDKTAFSPMDVNFIVYNADSSELLQLLQDPDAMEVTESYVGQNPLSDYEPTSEELVDSEASWRKAAGQKAAATMQEMRDMVPKSKPLGPNESDDVVIEEVIPDDSQEQLTSIQPTITGQDGVQHPPNIDCKATNPTQGDMEIFSLWNEEVLRRAAEQQKQHQDQSRMPPDAKLQIQVKQNEDCQKKEGTLSGHLSPATFVLQVISIDAPSVTCEVTGPKRDPCWQEVTNTSDQKSDNITPANTDQQNETTSCGPEAVSVTSMNYGVFKIPQ